MPRNRHCMCCPSCDDLTGCLACFVPGVTPACDSLTADLELVISGVVGDSCCNAFNGTFIIPGPHQQCGYPGAGSSCFCNSVDTGISGCDGTVKVGFDLGCECYPDNLPNLNANVFTASTGITFYVDPLIVDYLERTDAIERLCRGEQITLTTAPSDAVCNLTGVAICKMRFISYEECSDGPAPCPVTSYNCVSGVCEKLDNNTGTYATLTDCIISPCAEPPESYNCLFGTCIDPQDGTGIYGTLADCVTAGCGAPTCDSLVGCDMTLVAEIHGLNDCSSTGYAEFLSNLDAVYFLKYRPASNDFFESLIAVDGDGVPITGIYSDPHDDSVTGILWNDQSPGGGAHDEFYIYAISIDKDCTDGKVTLQHLTIYWQQFVWTDPDDPVAVNMGTSLLGTPSSTLAGTAGACTVGYMLTLYDMTDCNGNPVTFYIDGTVS